MATQHGPIKLQGTIGDLTFFRNSDGSYGAKSKTQINKARIANDPAFARTRENGREFGSAGKSGKLLRSAFLTMLASADNRMTARLHQAMMKCLKADHANLRGERTVGDGDLQQLLGFDFNARGRLSSTLLTPFSASVTRSTGAADISIPPFVPAVALKCPQGATHYQIEAGGAEVGFASDTSSTHTAVSGYLPIGNVQTAALSLSVNVAANSTLPLFQVMAVRFYQEVNGVKYALNNGGFDAMSIVNVDI